MIDEYIDVVIECDEDMEACFGEIQQVPMRANYDQTDPNAVDYILGREKLLSKDEIKLESGEGEDSIQQEGAKALGPKTIALGTSIAGCKGYYYSGVDFTNKYIYLSLTQRVPDKIVDYLFGLGEHDVINSKVSVISSPSNLTADANKYCIITTSGKQVSSANVTLNNYSASSEYKLRIKNISSVGVFTSDEGQIKNWTEVGATKTAYGGFSATWGYTGKAIGNANNFKEHKLVHTAKVTLNAGECIQLSVNAEGTSNETQLTVKEFIVKTTDETWQLDSSFSIGAEGSTAKLSGDNFSLISDNATLKATVTTVNGVASIVNANNKRAFSASSDGIIDVTPATGTRSRIVFTAPKAGEYTFNINVVKAKSITGLPDTFEQDKIYDIRITGGAAEYAIVDIDGAYYDASFSTEWQVGDAFSIVNSSHYDEIGKITSIDGNRIGYDTIGFDEINLNDSALEDFDSYTIVVPTRPECGVINLGEGAFSASDGGIAAGRFSANFARDGRNIGDYSFNAGRRNVVGYASGVVGADNKHPGKWGFTGGWHNETPADYAVTLGGGLINPYECGFIGGWCNDPTIPDLLLGIGYGFDGVKKNAFNIDIYGNVWVDKDPTKPMGVATKQYVDAPRVLPRIVFTDDTDGSKTKAAIDALAKTMPNGSSKQVVISCYPHFNGTYWYATIYKHVADYLTVDMFSYYMGYSRAALSKMDGVWGDFEWQNPPLYPGVEYRTTERWYGKPVYAKQCHCGLLPAVGTTAEIIHGTPCTQVIRTEGQMLYDGNLYGGDSLPYYRTDYGADIRITSTRFGIKLSVVSWDKDPSQISNVEASATIYYVKE